MPFVFSLDNGKRLTSDDLTLDEAVEVEATLGESWLLLNPLQHASHCRALLILVYSRYMTRDDAVAKVGALSLRAAIDCVDWVNSDDRPIEHDDGLPIVDPKEVTDGTGTT